MITNGPGASEKSFEYANSCDLETKGLKSPLNIASIYFHVLSYKESVPEMIHQPSIVLKQELRKGAS